MVWFLPLLPLLAGPVIAATPRPPSGRRVLPGAAAALTLAATLALAGWAAAVRPAAVYGWGAGLTLSLRVDPTAAVAAVTVPLIGLPVVGFAAAHEPERGLRRLLGALVAFVGAMELLVVADDLLTLLIAWELVGALSWGLIAHHWWDPDTPAAAAHAFNATRFGDLGLVLAAAAAFQGAGSLAYADLAALQGPALHVVAGGVVLAAAAKSAQGPFAPWLFSAMAGPTPVSALLHAAAMVAAGAYALIRLEPVLRPAGWFSPTVVAIGLVTALAGGVVAALQAHPKRLLAASTCAQYGLMFVAVGAGWSAVALSHFVAHAFLKALLFLAAGIAISAVGHEQLDRMRLGSQLPGVAVLSAIGSLALAAVPPLGGAWTKEAIVAAAGHRAGWLALATALAGALSAFYAARFHLLAFGPGRRDADLRRPEPVETAALAVLAAGSVGLGATWLPGAGRVVERFGSGAIPDSTAWETGGSLVLVGVGLSLAAVSWRRSGLAAAGAATRRADAWLGLTPLIRGLVVAPTLALARTLARADDRGVDAGVRAAVAVAAAASRVASRVAEYRVDAAVRWVAAAALSAAAGLRRVDDAGVDGAVRGVAAAATRAGRAGQRLQTGLAHQYYVLVAAGLVVLAVTAAVWR